MARRNTGVSKKINRQQLAALALCQTWARQFGAGKTMTPELAWAVSNGKFGTAPVVLSTLPLIYAPAGEPTVDTFKVALAIAKEITN